jgi:hypothetical protein
MTSKKACAGSIEKPEADLEFIDLTELDSERQQKLLMKEWLWRLKRFDLRKDLLVRL